MISVVVPTIGGREHHLERCLAAYAATTPQPYELIVVRDLKTCGLAWAAGARKAKGDYLHFSADDLEPLPGWAEAAMAASDAGRIPVARVLDVHGTPLTCVVYMREDWTPPNVLVPFLSRELWQLGDWVLPIHYGTDDWVTFLACKRGIEFELGSAYGFVHHVAPEGRDYDRRRDDLPPLAEAMAAAWYCPPLYRDIADRALQ